MHEPVPFSTDDAILAFALYIAGVPEFRPPTNRFTLEGLKKVYAGKGLRPIEALRDAWKRPADQRPRGQVVYEFENTPELPMLLAAYKDQQEIINREQDEDGGEHMRKIMTAAAEGGPDGGAKMDEREALLRIAFCVCRGRRDYLDRFRYFPPRLYIPREGEVKQVGKNATSYPGCWEISAETSDDHIRQLGLEI